MRLKLVVESIVQKKSFQNKVMYIVILIFIILSTQQVAVFKIYIHFLLHCPKLNV
jgi:hypothetical protein